jgi:rhamnose transport system ATP-binding protein
MTDYLPSAALECRDLRKTFAGVPALDQVSFALAPGEIHALVGENGAGKSTLVKIIAGQQGPDSGQVLVDGEPLKRFSPLAARAHGITIVPQHPDLFHSLTALENLFVGDWPRSPLTTVDWAQMRRRADAILQQMDVALDLQAPVAALSVAERQTLQIARALMAGQHAAEGPARSPILILDEPTAPLGQEETDSLFALVRRLHERGAGIIYISHRLAEVFELAQTVTVLRDGRLVGSHPVADVTRDSLVSMMVGRRVQADAPAAPVTPDAAMPPPSGPPLLVASGLSVEGRFADASLSVAPGEILGIAGVAGSGRNELLRALAGALSPTSGQVQVAGKQVARPSPRRMRDLGVAFVPADRHHEALVLPMTSRENITLGSLSRFASRLGLVRRGEEGRAAGELAQRLQVRAAGLENPVSTLSGGNQQKIALASRLATEPRVLLLEEPTQGVDVGARAEIHRQLRHLAASGVGIVLVSSDLPELLALSQRVVVMHRGRLVGEFAQGDGTQEKVLDLALGTSEHGVTAARPRPHPRPMRETGLAAMLLLLCVAVATRAPTFRELSNYSDLLVNNAYMLIAAAGMTLVIVTAGIDISVGSILAVAATSAGAAAAAGWSVSAVMAVALLVGAALGAANSLLVTTARIPPIIATLATLTVFRNVLIHLTHGRWINLPTAFREFGQSAPLHVPIAIWIAALALLVAAFVARFTVLGRSIYAVGSNEQAAAHMGIPVRRVQGWVYILMGLFAGLAAFVFASRWSAIQTNAGNGFEMVAITAVVVGGTNVFGGSGTILGSVLGVLLLGVITASLTPLHIEPSWERAFQGALILFAVVVDALRTRRGGDDA